jgi:hypothetical protein
MDCQIDHDPRLIRCHPHEATALAIYLRLLRQARLDCGGSFSRGYVSPDKCDTWFLSRVLFMPEVAIRSGLAAAIRSGLLIVIKDGVTLDCRSLRSDEGDVTIVTLVTTSDRVVIADWGDGWQRSAMTGSERQAKYRARSGPNKNEQMEPRDVTDRNVTSRVTESDAGDASDVEEKESKKRSEEEYIARTPEEYPGKEAPRRRTTADLIDECDPRCWGAADALRSSILRRHPAANIGTKPWDNRRRPPNAGTWTNQKKPPPRDLVVVEMEKAGTRLKWADEIRKMISLDKRTIEQIWMVMQWVEKRQPASLGPGFIIHSAQTFREKFGRIMVHIEQPSGSRTDGVDQAVAEMERVMRIGPQSAPPTPASQPDLEDDEVIG